MFFKILQEALNSGEDLQKTDGEDLQKTDGEEFEVVIFDNRQE